MLEAPEEEYAPAARRSRVAPPGSRRDFGEDFAGSLPDAEEHSDFDYRRRRNGYHLRFGGRDLELPSTLWGRVFGAAGLLVLAGVLVAALLALRSFFLRDGRFTVASSSFIQSTGNAHVSRAQLLSIFGEDVDRNIFMVPLAARRKELESLPWVQHATVMRLLPNHLRVSITERTPVAFVRQGSQIGMVDASGVLLDMPSDAPGDPHYSFPVVTGISANDPASTRAARMKIYGEFTGDLDSTSARISEKLSEVDLSNPEDVKALIPDGANDVLVHFGDTDFLARYQKFQQHLAEWRTQYPKLASVDLRYERQVVLEMQPGTTVSAVGPPPTLTNPGGAGTAAAPAKAITKAAPKPALLARSVGKPPPPSSAKVKPPAIAATRTAAPSADASEEWHMVVVKPHTKAAAALSAKSLKPQHSSQAAPQ